MGTLQAMAEERIEDEADFFHAVDLDGDWSVTGRELQKALTGKRKDRLRRFLSQNGVDYKDLIAICGIDDEAYQQPGFGLAMFRAGFPSTLLHLNYDDPPLTEFKSTMASLDFIEENPGATGLEAVDVSESPVLNDVSALGRLGMPNLTHLHLGGCPQLRDLSGLQGIRGHLSWLTFTGNPDLTTLPDIDVNSVSLNYFRGASLAGLERVTKMTEVQITSCENLRDISALTRCQSLKEIVIGELPIEFLPALPRSVTQIYASCCPNLTNISSLARCPNLRTCSLSGCKAISNRHVAPLATACRQLKSLNIEGTNVQDVSGFASRPDVEIDVGRKSQSAVSAFDGQGANILPYLSS